MKFVVSLLLIALISARTDPLFLNEKFETGFIPVTPDNSDIFYWFFYSRADTNTDPLVIWLTGGPGCSSELAVFMENGPFKV